MPKNNGITNAQNGMLNQNEHATGAHLKGDTFSFGTVDAPATVADGHEMWFGSGNSPGDYNVTTDGMVQTGLKVHIRNGADILPSGTGANGEQDYVAPAGNQSATRGLWNFDYVVNTANGSFDLSSPGLTAYDAKMQISISGGSFVTPQTATFDLNAATHVWTDEANPSLGFGGDDFNQPGASASLMAHVAENSVNPAFIAADFGKSLDQMTAAGTVYDIKLATFGSGSPNLLTMTHDVITLAANTSGPGPIVQ